MIVVAAAVMMFQKRPNQVGRIRLGKIGVLTIVSR